MIIAMAHRIYGHNLNRAEQNTIPLETIEAITKFLKEGKAIATQELDDAIQAAVRSSGLRQIAESQFLRTGEKLGITLAPDGKCHYEIGKGEDRNIYNGTVPIGDDASLGRILAKVDEDIQDRGVLSRVDNEAQGIPVDTVHRKRKRVSWKLDGPDTWGGEQPPSPPQLEDSFSPIHEPMSNDPTDAQKEVLNVLKDYYFALKAHESPNSAVSQQLLKTILTLDSEFDAQQELAAPSPISITHGPGASEPTAVEQDVTPGNHLKLLKELDVKLKDLLTRHAMNLPEDTVRELEVLKKIVKQSIVVEQQKVIKGQSSALRSSSKQTEGRQNPEDNEGVKTDLQHHQIDGSPRR